MLRHDLAPLVRVHDFIRALVSAHERHRTFSPDLGVIAELIAFRDLKRAYGLNVN
ncbi:MAG: hypothetical protein HYX77_00355 [Acidobacteria bacterium]|nr:hypothetical protein [Acidobacteriota bacterium]